MCSVVSCAGSAVHSRPITRLEKTYRRCVRARMSLNVIRCNDKPLHLHSIAISVQTKKEITNSKSMLRSM